MGSLVGIDLSESLEERGARRAQAAAARGRSGARSRAAIPSHAIEEPMCGISSQRRERAATPNKKRADSMITFRCKERRAAAPRVAQPEVQRITKAAAATGSRPPPVVGTCGGDSSPGKQSFQIHLTGAGLTKGTICGVISAAGSPDMCSAWGFYEGDASDLVGAAVTSCEQGPCRSTVARGGTCASSTLTAETKATKMRAAESSRRCGAAGGKTDSDLTDEAAGAARLELAAKSRTRRAQEAEDLQRWKEVSAYPLMAENGSDGGRWREMTGDGGR